VSPHFLPDEGAVAQISERLLDFFARVHHERPIAGNRFVQRLARNKQKPHGLTGRDHFDMVSIINTTSLG